MSVTLDFLTVEEAADLLLISDSRMRAKLRSGEIPAVKLGRSWVINRQHIVLKEGVTTPPGRPLSPERAWTEIIDGNADVAHPGRYRNRARVLRFPTECWHVMKAGAALGGIAGGQHAGRFWLMQIEATGFDVSVPNLAHHEDVYLPESAVPDLAWRGLIDEWGDGDAVVRAVPDELWARLVGASADPHRRKLRDAPSAAAGSCLGHGGASQMPAASTPHTTWGHGTGLTEPTEPTEPTVMVELPPISGPQDSCWRALLSIAERLPRGWMLIGGQMVFVLQVASGKNPEEGAKKYRLSLDVDVVMDIRLNRGALSQMHDLLLVEGFTQHVDVRPGTGFKYFKGNARFDVLAPDGLKDSKLRLGSARSVPISGASQAFHRTEDIEISYSGMSATITTPNLLGAALIKGSAAYTGKNRANETRHKNEADATEHKVRADATRHKNDIIRLLYLMTDAIHDEIVQNPLSKSERRIMRSIVSDHYIPERYRKRAAAWSGIAPITDRSDDQLRRQRKTRTRVATQDNNPGKSTSANCGAWMPRARTYCVLSLHHPGPHRSTRNR